MTLRSQLIIDYYLGGILHFVLKPLVICLGWLLRRDHRLDRCGEVTVLKLLGGGSLVIAYPSLLGLKRAPGVRSLRALVSERTGPFAESLGIFDEIVVIRQHSIRTIVTDSLAAIGRLFRCDAIVDLEVHSRLSTPQIKKVYKSTLMSYLLAGAGCPASIKTGSAGHRTSRGTVHGARQNIFLGRPPEHR